MCQLLCVVSLRAYFVNAVNALRGDLSQADEEVNLFLDCNNLIAQCGLGSVDCLALTIDAIQW